MRTRTVCCARTPNLEIAFFSGDFLPAGGAFPWRRQDGVPKGRKGLASPPGEAPPQAVMRGITITDTRRVSLRSMPLFAALAAWGRV